MNAAIFVSAGAGLPTAFVWFWHRLVCSGVLARTLDEALLSHKRLLAWHDDIGQISGWRRGYSAEAMASDRRISAAMASVLSLEAGIDGRTCCEIVSHSISAIMAKRLQTYETPDITVTFDPNISQHSGVCLGASSSSASRNRRGADQTVSERRVAVSLAY